jgi:hypothetical protein
MTLRYAIGIMKDQPLRDGYSITEFQGGKVARWPNGAMAKFYDDQPAAPAAAAPRAPLAPPVTHETAVALADIVFQQPRKQQRQTLIDLLDSIDWKALSPAPPPAPEEPERKQMLKPIQPALAAPETAKWDLWPALAYYRGPGPWQYRLEISWLGWSYRLHPLT